MILHGAPPVMPKQLRRDRRATGIERLRTMARSRAVTIGRTRCRNGRAIMARGDKSAYTDKQKRKAEHIEEGYEHRGVGKDEAERRAWATVNKESGGGKKSGSGRGKTETHVSSRKGGKRGGEAAARRPAAKRSASARKAAATRKRRASG
jgi:plasmid stabilization system protein ParE